MSCNMHRMWVRVSRHNWSKDTPRRRSLQNALSPSIGCTICSARLHTKPAPRTHTGSACYCIFRPQTAKIFITEKYFPNITSKKEMKFSANSHPKQHMQVNTVEKTLWTRRHFKTICYHSCDICHKRFRSFKRSGWADQASQCTICARRRCKCSMAAEK